MAILELEPFDLLTNSPRRVMSLQPLWANLASLGATSARLLMVTDHINLHNAIDGFNEVAVPFEQLPRDVRWYRSYYEKYLSSAIRETQYMRVYLVVSAALDDQTLARLIEGYGIGVKSLDAKGIPLPFSSAELQWETATDTVGKQWSCIQSAVTQTGSLHPQILHRLFALEFPVWCALDVWNYGRTEAIQLLRTKQAVALVTGSDEKTGRNAQLEANDAQLAIDAFRQEMNTVGVGLHEIRLSIIVSGQTNEELTRRLDVVRGASGIDLQRQRSQAAIMRQLFSADPPKSRRGSLVTSTGVALLSGSALSYRRPTKTDGVLLGFDANSAPVVINLFDEVNSAYNVVTAGQTGSGKTFFIMLLMLRSLLTGVRLIIIDPKGDIDLSFLGRDDAGNEICQRFTLGTSEAPINILDITFDELSHQIEFVSGMLSLLGVLNRHDTLEAALIDTLLTQLYEPIWAVEGTQVPTLDELQRLARAFSAENPSDTLAETADLLAFKLEPFVTGSRAPLFGEATNVDFSLNAPVTIFDVSRFPSRQSGGNLRAALFATLFALVNQAILHKRRSGDTVLTQFFVDEIGVMMRDAIVADYVSDKYKTARSLGVGMIVADQTIASLIGPADEQGIHHGNEMFANAPFRFIFYQEDSELETLSSQFPTMPPAYREAIHTLPRGQCIAQTPQGITRLIVIPSELERVVLSSSLRDKKRAAEVIAQMRQELLDT